MSDFFLPDTLTYHFPDGILTVTLVEDEKKLYRQLVCWCNLQRYWYYVLNTKKVEDQEYDEIENYLKDMENEMGKEYFKNPYSPIGRVGSSRRDDYPKLFRIEFTKEFTL